MADGLPTTYSTVAGVDTQQEEEGLKRLTRRLRSTWARHGVGRVELDFGLFANVIKISDTQGMAITTDGVGTKILVAQMMNKYDTLGIDCVAMNVNDLICVGAEPQSMVDYIAIQRLDPRLLDELGIGLEEGARQADISIPGGEIAQIPDMLRGEEDRNAFDLAGTAVGTVSLDGIIVGRDIRPGDVVIGIKSSGVHSNGLSFARRVLFGEKTGLNADSIVPELSDTLGAELLIPTHIYVKEIMQILNSGLRQHVKALIHITSDGFMNLSRAEADCGYILDQLPEIPPIFELIRNCGQVESSEMFSVFNMGVGFCVVADKDHATAIIDILNSYPGKEASVIGYAVPDPRRRVTIPNFDLVGENNEFRRTHDGE